MSNFKFSFDHYRSQTKKISDRKSLKRFESSLYWLLVGLRGQKMKVFMMGAVGHQSHK